MEAKVVTIAVSNPRLGHALEVALADQLPGFGFSIGTVDDVDCETVVTTPSCCSLADCRRLVASGATVIIISSIALRSEQILYEEAGASSYLPMSIDATHLIAHAVKRAATRQRDERTASCTTLSQDRSPRPS
ncbi:MAG: hypothetical protein ABI577_06165 [bacterium]